MRGGVVIQSMKKQEAEYDTGHPSRLWRGSECERDDK